jgi:hypothetical protein
MRREHFKFIGFFCIVFFYALLYIATSYNRCDETCEKLGEVYTELHKTRPYILGVYKCNDTIICIPVRDTVVSNWTGVADTACLYLKAYSFTNIKVAIINNVRNDTVAIQKCP